MKKEEANNLLKEAERMIYSLQDAYVSHPEADRLRKRIRSFLKQKRTTQLVGEDEELCAYCNKIHDIRLACPEWIEYQKKELDKRKEKLK